MNKITKIFGLGIITLSVIFLPQEVFAIYENVPVCSASISFDVNPKSANSSQNFTVSGWVKAGGLHNTSVYGNKQDWCRLNGTDIVQYKFLLTITDNDNQSAEISNSWIEKLGDGSGNPVQVTISPSFNLNKTTNVVGIVKATDGNGNWFVLTKSAPVAVTIGAGQATPTTNTTGTLYGCKAGDVYACYSSESAAKTAGCTTVSNITNDKCGCTDAEYSSGVKSTNCKVNGGSGSTTGTTNSNTTSGDSLYNPLPEDDLTKMFLTIIQGFLGIIGVWAVAFVIIGGFRMVMAAGNEEQYTAAKKTVIWSVLGLVIALMSFSIIAIVQNLLNITTK